MEQFLPAIIIAVVVTMVMLNQIKRITERIDAKGESQDSEIYAKFASIIQEKIRVIKLSIDSDKEPKDAPYRLKESVDAESLLEQLSDMMRTLVFFETMNAKRRPSEAVEGELFELLSDLDKLINENFENGEELADALREELGSEYARLQE
jgi:hypothetical protein